jgi:peptide/nickel transport system permease protein
VQGYVIRRLLLLIPTLLIVTIIIFCLVRWVPGDAVDFLQTQLSQGTGSTVAVDRAAIEHMLGLDVPIYIQYGRWLGILPTPDEGFDGLLEGNLGNSIIQHRPALDLVVERLPVTLELGLLALLISILFSLPLGVYSAVRQDTWGDYGGRTIAILMMSIPIFWTGTLIMIYPSVWWNWSPPMEYMHLTDNPLGNLGMLLLPAVILGASTGGGTVRLTRTMMLEVMRQDYIKTAWSKGLTERVVIMRHGVKNAFIPVITVIGGGLGMLIGGAVIIEQIFNLPGMGMLMLQALNQRDYPLVSAVTLILSVFVMLMNLVVDLAYTWLDPRIRFK